MGGREELGRGGGVEVKVVMDVVWVSLRLGMLLLRAMLKWSCCWIHVVFACSIDMVK